MTIVFSKCSDNDVAELLFACYEPCGWLCDIGRDCIYCPGELAKINVVKEFKGLRSPNGVCVAHEYRKAMSKPEIARQCHEEIMRRETPAWIKEIEKEIGK